ncbi:mucin-2 isoform X50 [Tympanuchus pallidicinctus]|uniref:mucin-2 isoform X50 n=1 Tax=Tympanuchus pallidicinctus TaxID=109042 RepID=UPI0022874C18|nr:mucin-2 isoform X50 [Tympanuchus pallidicinctus]
MGLRAAGLLVLWLALSNTSEIRKGRTRNHGHYVCSTWGNNHFKTFDGDIYQFPGTCEYNFVSDCQDSYREFSVHIQRALNSNNHPEIQYILVTVTDFTVYLKPDLAVVDGRIVKTPYYSSSLLIENNGVYMKVYAKVGLILIWNQEDALMVELDSKFGNQTCGLCGDYNGVPIYNEFISGVASYNSITYGNLQKISKPNDECEDPDETQALPSCTEHRDECEKLLTSSAFTDCHSRLNLETYIQACMQDKCSCEGSEDSFCLCSTISEYSRQCSHAGGRPGEWRTENFCYKTCPGNMVYRESSSPCMDTCSHLEISSLCEEHYMDGCFCPEGTVYDDITENGCVPVSECYCRLHGKGYSPGETISNECEECTCDSGRWTCQDLPCPGTCSVEGGSHITTFDGKKYTFHGDCYYVLAKSAVNNTDALLAELAPCGSTDGQTCLKTVVLLVDDKKNVVVFRSDGSVSLNEMTVNVPHVSASFSVFKPSSYYLIVHTSFGLQLQIQLSPVMQLFVTANQTVQDLQGLCGNFNGMEGDDFKTTSGLVEATGSAFANTWKAQSTCADQEEKLEDPCSLSIESANYAEHWCSLLKNSEGPFASCHSVIDPAEYYKRCKYDTCLCKDSEECLCAALSSYSRACAFKGIILGGWRQSVCSAEVSSCPGNQVFLYNLTMCQQTCRSIADGEKYCLQDFAPVDGCGCPDNTYLDNEDTCVPISKCPCYYKGSYLEPGDYVIKDGERCVCRNAKVQCTSVTMTMKSVTECSSNKTYFDCNTSPDWTSQTPVQLRCGASQTDLYQSECVSGCVCPEGLFDDGRGGCVVEEDCPCIHNSDWYNHGQSISVDCNTCTCQKGIWSCTENVCYGTCMIYGSGHYITFDGKFYDFDGSCEYVATQDYCGDKNSGGSFSIITENVPCGTTGVTCSKAIKMFIGKTELKLENKDYKEIQRDVGDDVYYQNKTVGLYLVIEASNGVMLIWDKKTTVFIKLTPDYKGKVCGLCGNFDDKSNNDFTSRSGLQETSALEFGNSWKQSSVCPDVTEEIKPCDLKPHRKSWAEKECSLILSEIFKICHSKVNPSPFYDACVHDACSCDSGGDCDCFCSAVAAYAQECTKAQACVFWRSPDICPIFCDYYNPRNECEWHYEPCGSNVMTCRMIYNVSTNFSVPYLEGCYPRCPHEKPIYNEETKECVAADECWCYHNGNPVIIGGEIPTEENCTKCICRPSGSIECSPIPGCPCVINGTSYDVGETVATIKDGDICTIYVCAENGSVIPGGSYPCPLTTSPSTITTSPGTSTITTIVTTSPPVTTTPCLGLICDWSEWFDVSNPEEDGGDYETYEEIRKEHGNKICTAPENIECRAKDSPDKTLEELGQKVECNVTYGLICKNEEQDASIWHLCYNYEIRVNCCEWHEIPCGTASTPSSTPTASSVTTGTTVPTTTTRQSTTITTTPTPTATTTSQPTSSVTTPVTSASTVSTAAPTPTPSESPTSTATTTPFSSSTQGTTTTVPGVSSSTPTVTSTVPPTIVTQTHSPPPSLPVTNCECIWTDWIDSSQPDRSDVNSGDYEIIDKINNSSLVCVKAENITCRAKDYPNISLEELGQKVECSVNTGLICNNKDQENNSNISYCHNYEISICCTPNKPECIPTPEYTTAISTTVSHSTTTTIVFTSTVSSTTAPPTPTESAPTTTSGTTLSSSTASSTVSTTPITSSSTSGPTSVSTSTPRPTPTTSLTPPPTTTQGPTSQSTTSTVVSSTTAPPTPTTSAPTTTSGTTLSSSTASSTVSTTPITSSSTSGPTSVSTSTPRPTPTTSLTPPPTTTEVDCTVPEDCIWTDWIDVSYPQYGPGNGDDETFETIQNKIPSWNCTKAENISCRAEKFPDTPIEDLGQKVECDVNTGLICKNDDQTAGGVIPMPVCLNYQIKVCCTPPLRPECTTAITTTTRGETSTTVSLSPTTSTIYTPSVSSTTAPPTPTTSAPTTTSGTTLSSSTASSTVSTTPITSSPTSGPTSVSTSTPRPTPTTSLTPPPTTTEGPTSQSTTSTSVSSSSAPPTPTTSAPTTTSGTTLSSSTASSTVSTTPVTSSSTSGPTSVSTSTPRPTPTTSLTPPPTTTQGPTSQSTTSTVVSSTTAPPTPTTSAPTTTSGTTLSSSTASSTVSTTPITSSSTSGPTSVSTSTPRPTPTTSLTPPPTTTEVDCTVPEDCIWTDWIDVSYPQYGPGNGDDETFETIQNKIPSWNCTKAENISCRAEKFPDTPIEDLGQKVECDVNTGLICKNDDQTAGGVIPMPVCLNYQIKVCCTPPLRPECTTAITTTTRGETSTTVSLSPTTSTIYTPSVSSTTAPPTPTTSAPTTTSGTTLSSSTASSTVSTTPITSSPTSGPTSVSTSTPRPTPTTSLTPPPTTTEGPTSQSTTSTVVSSTTAPPTPTTSAPTTTSGTTLSSSTASSTVSTTPITSSPTSGPTSVSTSTPRPTPTTSLTPPPTTTEGPTSQSTTSTSVTIYTPSVSSTTAPPTPTTSAPTTTSGTTLSSSTASSTVSTTPITSSPTSGPTSVSTSTPRPTPTTSLTPPPTTTEGPTSQSTTSTVVSSTTAPPTPTTSAPTTTSGTTLSSSTASSTVSTTPITSSPTSGPTSVSTSTPRPTPTTSLTPPPTTTEVDCTVPEDCIWTDWIDVSYPQYGPGNGDDETFETIQNKIPSWNCTKAENISCRAEKFPDTPIEDLGQKVECDVNTGLICKNDDQTAGGVIPMPVCLNYQIKVCCTPPLRPECTTAITTTTRGETSTTVSLSPTTSTIYTPSVSSTTAPPTPTTSAPTTTSGTTLSSSTASSTVSTTPITSSPTSGPTSVSTSTPRPTPTTSLTPPPTTTEGPTSQSTTSTVVSSTTAPPTPTTSAPTTTSGTTLSSSTASSTVSTTPITSSPTSGPTSVSTSTPRPTPTTSLTPPPTTTEGPTSQSTTSTSVSSSSAPPTPTTSAPTTTSGTTLSSSTASSTVSTTPITSSSTSGPTSVSTSTPRPTPTTSLTPPPTTTQGPTSQSTTSTVVSSTTAPPTPTTSAPTTTSGTTLSSSTASSTVSTTPITSSPTSGPTSVSTSTPRPTPTTSLTPPPTTTEVDCTVPEDCIWTDWIDVSYPQYGPGNGDDETFETIQNKIPSWDCTKAENISCRAEKFPDTPIEDLGQKVECDVNTGLICKNDDQTAGGVIPMPVCLNYQIKVCCTPPLRPECTTAITTTTRGETSTTVSLSPTTSTIYTPSVSSTTAPPTPTTSAPTTTSGTTLSSSTASSTVSTTPITSSPTSGPTSVSTSTPRPTPTTSLTPPPTTTEGTSSYSTTSSFSSEGTTTVSESSSTASVSTPISTQTTAASSPLLTPSGSMSPPSVSTVPSTVTTSGTTPTKPFTTTSGTTSSSSSTVTATSITTSEIVSSGSATTSGTTPISSTVSVSGSSTYSTVTTLSTLSSTTSASSNCTISPDESYAPGESWWLCNCTKAICVENNTVVIVPVICEPPPKPTCSNGLAPVQVIDDDQCCWHWECDCYCTGWGDPHYLTFDGLYYSYQGNCTYVLVEEIEKTVDNFGVYIDNYHCDAQDVVSCPRAIIVRHETQEVRIETVKPNTLEVEVTVNKQAVALPYKKFGLMIYESGINSVVEIPELKMNVTFNGLSFSIRMPYSLFGNNTQGQCGTCSNNTADDCRLPNGNIAENCETMADYWQVVDPSKPQCSPGLIPTKAPSTTTGQPCKESSLCELLWGSVFEKCHAVVKPDKYYAACVFDSCMLPDLDLECSSLQIYAAVCADQNVCIDWRSHTNGVCSYECSKHKEYRACGPIQETTCKSSTHNETSVKQVEGCFCPNGTMLYDSGVDVCVHTCGCVGLDLIPREFGEKFIVDCQDCVCLEGGNGIVCEPHTCPEQNIRNCSGKGFYEVTEVNSEDSCCPIVTCKCNTSLCTTEPLKCTQGFEVHSYIPSDECCPVYQCVPKNVCVHQNAEFLPNSSVFVDKCHDCFCTNEVNISTQLNVISCEHIPCNTYCEPGYELKQVEGECCGKCVQTKCIIHTSHGSSLILNPGEFTNDPYNNCTVYSCTNLQNQLIPSTSEIMCPAFSEESCKPGTITLLPNGCCKTCEPLDSPTPCFVREREDFIVYKNCRSLERVVLTECEGTCETFSLYSVEASSMEHSCSCCKEVETSMKEVELQCPSGKSITHKYVYVEKCGCQDTQCVVSESSESQSTEENDESSRSHRRRAISLTSK